MNSLKKTLCLLLALILALTVFPAALFAEPAKYAAE